MRSIRYEGEAAKDINLLAFFIEINEKKNTFLLSRPRRKKNQREQVTKQINADNNRHFKRIIKNSFLRYVMHAARQM